MIQSLEKMEKCVATKPYCFTSYFLINNLTDFIAGFHRQKARF